MAKCKGCDSRMVWGRNEQSGKGIPLDPDPVPDGNLLKVGETEQGEIVVRFLKKDEKPPEGAVTFRSHFASCSASDQFRRT